MSKRWCYTLNNFSHHDALTMAALPSVYHIIGKEMSESLTPHLQGFIIFDKTKRLTGVKKLHAQAHWEIAKGTSTQAADYCKKENNFQEYGVFPASQGKRTDLKRCIDDINDGLDMKAVAKNNPETFVKYHRGLREYSLLVQEEHTPQGLRGEWYVGAPGTGKSRKARDDNPGAYLKAQNKWWDGYNGQSVVILDDMDSNVLGHHLKIWADRYPCPGETKGGTVNLSHELFIVTSNYTIEQLWPDDYEMQSAIKRRFTVTRFPSIAGQPL